MKNAIMHRYGLQVRFSKFPRTIMLRSYAAGPLACWQLDAHRGILFPSPTVPFAHETCWHGFAPCSAGMAKASESPAQHGKSSSRLRKA